MIVVFLALIRCIAEPFRLQYYSSTSLTYHTIKPFLIGALISSVACLILVILSFYSNYKLILVVSILTIAALFWVKYFYHV
jgi:hypothetical protein